MLDQFAEFSPYKGTQPDSGGGSYSKGWNFINPATGQVDPSYRPPEGTIDSRGQSGSPVGGHEGGGGGAPMGGNYGGTGATTGTNATYGGGTTTATAGSSSAGSAFDAANAFSSPAAGVATQAPAGVGGSSGVWTNVLKALSTHGGSYASAMKEYGPFILSLIAGLTQKKGTYEQQPESPTLTAARNRQLGYVDNSPTRNMYASLIQQFLAGGGAGAWHSPAPLAGGQFYQSQGMSGMDPAIAEYLRQVSAGLGGGGAMPTQGGSFVPEKDRVDLQNGR